MSRKLLSKSSLFVVLCAIVCIHAGFGTNVSFAKTYFVSKSGDDTNTGESWEDAFLTIKKATELSGENDDIWVAEGTYIEGETIENKSGVSMYGGFEGIETSIEDRDTSESKTIIDGDNSRKCVNNYGTIDGFNITKGNSSSNGGGIYNSQSGIVSNCIIYSNSTSADGGAIHNNTGKVRNCAVYENTSDGKGGGICNEEGIITNSVIYSNSTYEGGGISNYKGLISNCTVYKNSANFGGGIYCSGGTISNCIILNNGNYSDLYYFKLEKPNISYSCFSESNDMNGNIHEYPLFVNISGDISSWNFHLQNGSPCIDRGTKEGMEQFDIEGNPRPGNDNKVCMGAYESPDEYRPGNEIPAKRLYVSKNGDNSNGLSWNTSFTSIKYAISQIQNDEFYEIWVAEGVYTEGDTIINPWHSLLYGGFAGIETQFDARDISNNKTIIDGNNSYGCIKNRGKIDGFYITKGSSDEGGGICNTGGIVKNCVIYNNLVIDFSYFGAIGGGISNGGGTINNCIVHSNSATGNTALGGGISNGSGTISNCTVFGNTSIDSDNNEGIGGGIRNTLGTVKNCIVYENSTDTQGGGIYNYEGIISGCKVYSNSVTDEYYGLGGGIYNKLGTIQNCMVYENSAANSGGGICNYFFDCTNTNCTVYLNSAPSGGGIYNELGAEISNCIVRNNENGDCSEKISYSCFSEADGTDGNINFDPLFLNNSGDISTWNFYLRKESPCIDSGKNCSVTEDINGVSRPQGSGWDMGAYEFFNAQTGDVNMDTKIDDLDIDVIKKYICGKMGIFERQIELADFNSDGKIDVADIISLVQFLN
jgi:dockerin type I repeat protein